MDLIPIKYAHTIVRLIRPASILYVLLWYFLGYLMVQSNTASSYIYIITAIGFGFSLSSGNVLNDYFDKDIDATANKKRPIQNNEISDKEILLMYFILAFTSLIISFFLDQISILANILLILSGIIYSHPFFSFGRKGFMATIIMIFAYHILPFMTGYIQNSNSIEMSVPVLMFFLGFLFVRLGRLFMKDYEDNHADKMHNKITPLQIMGNNKLFYLITASSVLGTLFVCISYLMMFPFKTSLVLLFLSTLYLILTIYSAYLSGTMQNNLQIIKFRRYGHYFILAIFIVILCTLS